MDIILNTVCNFRNLLDDVDLQDVCAGKKPKAKIGHIRADHDGYRWWATYFPCHEELKTENIRIEMNEVCAEIIENRFRNLEEVKAFCYNNKDAKFGDCMYVFYIEHKFCNYELVFILRKGDYNMYLHAYKKP